MVTFMKCVESCPLQAYLLCLVVLSGCLGPWYCRTLVALIGAYIRETKVGLLAPTMANGEAR